MENTIIQERYQELNKNYRNFVTSNFAAQSAMALGRKAGLTGDRIIILENAIVLYLLLLLSFEEMIAFISIECEILPEEATDIVYALLASLPTDYSAAHSQAFLLLNPESEETNIPPSVPTAPQVEPRPTIRTMQDNTYTNTQEALLNESTPKQQ